MNIVRTAKKSTKFLFEFLAFFNSILMWILGCGFLAMSYSTYMQYRMNQLMIMESKTLPLKKNDAWDSHGNENDLLGYLGYRKP